MQSCDKQVTSPAGPSNKVGEVDIYLVEHAAEMCDGVMVSAFNKEFPEVCVVLRATEQSIKGKSIMNT